MNELVLADRASEWRRLKSLVLDSVSSPITRRVYNLGLDEFIEWFGRELRPSGFTKAAVTAWRVALEARGLGSVSINVRITAVRKLAVEAADNGLLAPELASGIARIKGVRSHGVRVGNWLSLQQAQRLLNTPDVRTKKGLRDRAMFAVLLGCGLRRSELTNLTMKHVQQRDNRWCIVDLLGKHGRVRTIPMPAWVKNAIDAWTSAAPAIVQASSDSLGPSDDKKFADAFDQVADRILQDTCRRNACTQVGFFIDPIARDPDRPYANYAPGEVHSTYAAKFKPDPVTTGPFLYNENSILGIDSYSPEGWIDGLNRPVNEPFKIAWKEEYSRRWQATGVPFLQDVTPGYNGSKLFTGAGLHVWGYDDPWRAALLGMTQRYGRKGMIYNSWNGYCEGLAGMVTIEQGTKNVDFIRSLMATY